MAMRLRVSLLRLTKGMDHPSPPPPLVPAGWDKRATAAPKGWWANRDVGDIDHHRSVSVSPVRCSKLPRLFPMAIASSVGRMRLALTHESPLPINFAF
jgi:hypothetical protein